jgi:hypothetical protein
LKNKNGCSNLEFFEICLRVFLKNTEIFLKKAGRELKFGMNMCCLLININGYSNLEFFEIRLRVFLKNSEIFLKKRSKNCRRVSMVTNVMFFGFESLPDKFWTFFRKISRIDLTPSVSGS